MLLSELLTASLAWQPDPADTVLIAGGEADLPLIESVIATLPAKARGRVFVEVETADRVGALEVPGRVCVSWLVRERGQSLRTAVDAYLAEMLPVEAEREHRVYGWIAGQSHASAITA